MDEAVCRSICERQDAAFLLEGGMEDNEEVFKAGVFLLSWLRIRDCTSKDAGDFMGLNSFGRAVFARRAAKHKIVGDNERYGTGNDMVDHMQFVLDCMVLAKIVDEKGGKYFIPKKTRIRR